MPRKALMNPSPNSPLDVADTREAISPKIISFPMKSPISMLPDRPPPWKEFIFSIGSQAALVLFLLWLTLLHPHVLAPPIRDYHNVVLVSTPHPVNHDVAPVQHLKAPPPTIIKMAQSVRVPPSPVRTPPETPVAPKIETATKLPQQPTPVVIPKEAVKINVFSTGSSQAPTIEKPPTTIQTGGFGDPHGVAVHENKNRPVTIAQQGSFDLPSGGGYGNGTADQRGVRGVVVSTGFGDGVATGDYHRNSNRTVGQAGFGDAQVASPNQNVTKQTEAKPRIKPAEILSKPTPAYTEEARKLRIEGEVLLEVTFEASGSVRVLRVIRGLGHGLDESAMKAAQQIKFNPAQKDGQPVDFTGLLHITFQVA